MNRLLSYIDDLQRYAEEALSFIQGMDKVAFLNDRKTQQAVTLNLITLGEISTTLKQKEPDFLLQADFVPWKDIAGMRHRLVHGYNEVDPLLVWTTLNEQVPELLKKIPNLIAIAKKY
ncbi:HepT-like ribonuclease domain-containing protein [Lonepinella sp. BR2271]|uniref:HepT-like ribonuclease domain-containing protein n=1 Tax=Lonepinella sp. BR2271 TaxID=3434550 RepID=UPI003F6DB038